MITRYVHLHGSQQQESYNRLGLWNEAFTFSSSSLLRPYPIICGGQVFKEQVGRKHTSGLYMDTLLLWESWEHMLMRHIVM